MLRAAKSVKRTPSLSLAFVKLISTAIEYISSERTFNRHFLYYKMEIFFFQIHPLRALTVQYDDFSSRLSNTSLKLGSTLNLPPFLFFPPSGGIIRPMFSEFSNISSSNVFSSIVESIFPFHILPVIVSLVVFRPMFNWSPVDRTTFAATPETKTYSTFPVVKDRVLYSLSRRPSSPPPV